MPKRTSERCENHQKNGDLDENTSNSNPEENKLQVFQARCPCFDVAEKSIKIFEKIQ